jgi:hypothetical protein
MKRNPHADKLENNLPRRQIKCIENEVMNEIAGKKTDTVASAFRPTPKYSK